jgi:hypothetical protein
LVQHIMKQLSIIFFLFINLQVFSQISVSVNWAPNKPASKSDTIYYSASKKLEWSNFKGKTDPQSDATAITSSGFGYVAGMHYRNEKTTITISVYCYFSKQNSWVRAGGQSDYALNHEQHHFDVTYIVTNLFMQKLKEAKFTRNNYDALIDKIYTESCKELERMQNEYDGQTRNGRLKNIQANWNEKIEKKLALL